MILKSSLFFYCNKTKSITDRKISNVSKQLLPDIIQVRNTNLCHEEKVGYLDLESCVVLLILRKRLTCNQLTSLTPCT